MDEAYIVLGNNSANQVQAFGTRAGKPFRTEQAAERAARKLDKSHPRLDFIVLPLTPEPVKE